MDIINNLITDFSVDNLKQFFRQKISSFKPHDDEYEFLFNDNEYVLNNYEDIKKIGEADLNNSDDLLIITAKTLEPLTDRTGKKKQFDIAKKILKNDYKDAAFFIFYDEQGRFRFSFIRANFIGTKKDYTDFKRYTYFVSPEQTNKTFISQISKCDFLDLESVIEAFSVEPLNKEFYKHIADVFYDLIGGKIKIGNKTHDYEAVLQLPSLSIESNRKTYQEFAVRLIGRIVFIWFLKNKTSKNGLPLIPKEWFSSEKVKNSENFYHNYLEKLFFEILNKPIEKRIADLPDEHKIVPFLNGGLFEPCNEDFYISGNNNNSQINYALKIPDTWILKLFETLEQFNFTIDENSLNDQEISIDPEMLGTIFENLLAEIDPDTEKSARNSTGSFYTPREIVDYMVEESLVTYLKTKTNIDEDKLHKLFKENDLEENYFENPIQIINAFDQIKILDPACGSGAFPMGALHKINLALQKLDPNAEIWKDKQLAKIENVAYRNILKTKLDKSNVEYIRKIGIVQNSIYGIDIQPIATEISKLRSFLSLVIDENINDDEYNRDILPLPNLEFKFVTANTLIGLHKVKEEAGGDGNTYSVGALDFGETNNDLEKLQGIRKNYLNASQDKQKIKTEFLELQKIIANKEFSNNGIINQKAQQIIGWNPFSHEKADWFDPKWMFGVEKFDIVMGNPPYKQVEKNYVNENLFPYSAGKDKGKQNLYKLFIERGYTLAKEQGYICLIVQSSLMADISAEFTRELLLTKTKIQQIIEFPKTTKEKGAKVFDNVLQGTCIIIYRKEIPNKSDTFSISIGNNKKSISDLSFEKISQKEILKIYFNGKYFPLIKKGEFKLLKKISNNNRLNNLISESSQGDFNLTTSKKEYSFKKTNINMFRGKHVHRYCLDENVNEYMNMNFRKDLVEKNRRYHYFLSQNITGTTDKNRLHFCLTNSDCNFLCGHSINKFRIDDESLNKIMLGILNSKLMDWFFRGTSTNNHVNMYEIKELPIPEISKSTQQPFETLVDKIITKKEQGEDTTAEERKIDLMVYKLYELTYEEVKMIEPEFAMSKEEYEKSELAIN